MSATGNAMDASKRSTSCPDERQIVEAAKKKKEKERAAPKEAASQKKSDDGSESDRELVSSGMQTDEFVVFPYEHLFPQVLPHCHVDPAAGGNGDEAEEDGKRKGSTATNPYSLLDDYMENLLKGSEDPSAAVASDADPARLKRELALTRTLMLYERQRREILGMRNRRLLGKTKSSRVLEEQNTALRDQLHIVESESRSLLQQLETVRMRKHEVEEARARGARQRDTKIEELGSENRALREKVRELEEALERRDREVRDEREETRKVEAALFRAKSEIQRLEEKEDLRRATEAELVHLRQEILLMGELQLKYKEQQRQPAAISAQKESELMSAAVEQQVAALSAEALTKSAELEAARGKLHDLEAALAKKEANVAEQKKIIKRIKEENQEDLAAVERANGALLETQYHLETRIMQLQDQLTHAGRGHGGRGARLHQPALPAAAAAAVGGEASAGGAGASSALPVARNQAVHHSANMDIMAERPKASASTLDSDDKTSFVVGSPPLSSDGGSLNSENSEVFRRILRSDPVNLERCVDLDVTAEEATSEQEVEIGSAVSAKEAMETSASSSVNGKH